jgi:hypothetical protein
MSQGWVKVYRELLDKPIWLNSTANQKTILITLLLMVNHKANQWEWKGEKFNVKPGQIITSLESIKNKAGQGITIDMVRKAIKRFQKMEFLTNESTKEGRLISVINWSTYQSEDEEQTIPQTKARPKRDQSETKARPSNKNDKNKKNGNNENIYCPEPKNGSRPEAVFEMLIKSKKDFPEYESLYKEDIDSWKEAFPEIDIFSELKKMNAWSKANPGRQKTSKGIRRFIFSWLERENNKPKNSNNPNGGHDPYANLPRY